MNEKKYLVPIALVIGLMCYSCAGRNGNIGAELDEQFLFKKTLGSTQLAVSVVASGLKTPWEITYASNDNSLWFTEIGGSVNKLNLASGQITKLLEIPDVFVKKSYGLLGFAIHPDLKNNPYAVLHYTYLKHDKIQSRLVRYTYANDTLTNPKTLLDSIPGRTYHNGSRIIITPNDIVYMSMGDVGNKKGAQDIKEMTGKILRLNIDGSIPEDNPFQNNPVWSWGHRNPQGLVMGNNMLYSSEHGEANDDEINIIKPNSNYGWPDVTGICNQPYEQNYCSDSVIIEPIKTWTPTIAPAGIDYYSSDQIPEWNNSLLVTSLKDVSLRVLKLSSDGLAVKEEVIAFNRQFGRIRDVAVTPGGDIYLCTSNNDWHPKSNPEFYPDMELPSSQDDRIIRIRKANSVLAKNLLEMEEKNLEQAVGLITQEEGLFSGQQVYEQYCGVCHKSDGSGAEGMFPPITKSEWVSDKNKLIGTVLNGLSGRIEVKGKIYDQEMPSFKFLSESQLADVLTYVRSSFGNAKSPVTIEDITEFRKKSGP